MKSVFRFCQALAFSALFCQTLANAETVGVIGDDATGRLYPAAVEARVAPAILELDMEPNASVTVTGMVQSVFSDAPEVQEKSIHFDTNFPESRLTFENWGINASGTTYTSNNMLVENGRLDKLAAGVAMFTPSNGTLWVDSVQLHTNGTVVSASVDFHPPVEEQLSIQFSAIRAAVLDDYGLHSGEPTLGEIWQNIVVSPNLGNTAPALASSADGRIVYKTAQGAKVWRSRDGGDAWEEIAVSPTLDYYPPALASSADGRIVYKTVQTAKVWRSRDGGDSWEEIADSPIVGNTPPALASSADGRIVYKTADNAKVWRSRDGGDSWEEIAASPTVGNNTALASSADGRIVYKTAQSAKVWRSRDGGDAWEEIADSPTVGYYTPALASSADGRIVYKTAGLEKVWRSCDGGDSWEEIADSPTLLYNPALACSADGRIVYKTAYGATVYKATPLFGISSTSPYTVLIDAVPGVVEQVKDFYAADLGERRAYWALRTGENRYAVYDTGTDPIGWYDIAWKEGGTWYVRGTNGPVATTAASAPAAVSAAVEAWDRNKATEWQYQPHYGYPAFTGGTNVEWALTFVPDAYAVTNAPGVSAMGVLYSAFGGTDHWSTDAFRIDILSSHPTVSKVTWAGENTVHATIRYLPEN